MNFQTHGQDSSPGGRGETPDSVLSGSLAPPSPPAGGGEGEKGRDERSFAALSSAPLWTAASAAAATGGRAVGDWSATGVAIDSRTAAPGDLFVALRGPRHDGHDFVRAAFARGAAAAVVAHDFADLPQDAPLLRVADTLAALGALAAAARRRSRARIVAVTGSVGKTGTKEALRLALSVCGPTAASAGSLNNHWGVPLSLARLPAEAAYGVFELGMNHAGEIAALTRLVRPHVAVVTTVEPAHLGFFPSVEAIADAKAEIFEGLEPGGIAVLYRDNPYYERLAAAARRCGAAVLSFGAAADAAVRLAECALRPDGSTVAATLAGAPLRYELQVPGRHWVTNSLAVLAAAHAVGADAARAASALARLEAPTGRGRRHDLVWQDGRLTLFDESYNASPASMRAAFAVIGAAEP
ncbi:MAG TPA: UDP-N-acetylmuramoyl-tripeptide--D-alanyl-D-alanine ligase, partial [Stellaceae bacterium]|nr:UDP-N-acetylmuramoyl-tripeptide--D-alanyl-D-alanine ligase [Stellaceae bacterium]